MTDIEKLIRPNILGMEPYSTARDEFSADGGPAPEVFLDANENPYDWGYNRYPDPHQKELKGILSKIKNLPVENIFLGNGSDEAIDLIFRVFCRPGVDNVVCIAPSYGMYSVCAGINDIEVRSVMLGDDFSLPVDALFAAADANTKAMFICSPNNPSGNAYDPEVLLDICRKFEGIVVVDEAYADFSKFCSLKESVLEVNNLVVLQTLSKAWGMAGLRLGMAFANATIIDFMSRVKYPYNIDQAALNVITARLNELGTTAPGLDEIISEREKLAEELKSLPAVAKVYPSDANFLLVKFNTDATEVYNLLIAAGTIVRNRTRVPLCEGCLRITVGTPEENRKVISQLKAL